MMRALLLAATLMPVLLTACQPTETPHRAEARTIVVGFDGLDPVLLERWMDEGRLPHFAALRTSSHYQRLGTSNPAQSPVAWASFATGHNPGEHAIFDFLRRAPGSYGIDFSIAEQKPPEHVVSLFGYRVPLDSGELINRRVGEPFWMMAEQTGQRASVFRVPVTYPPDPVSRMISGMGAPDLLGSQGTYTILASRRLP
ncbi:MAG: alkaline phosphatase family protein, partial [Dokdonella sp.]